MGLTDSDVSRHAVCELVNLFSGALRKDRFRRKDGQLFGLDTQGVRFPVSSSNSKDYLPVGDCLIGHIDGPDCMALVYMNSAGVKQMIGYTMSSWYG